MKSMRLDRPFSPDGRNRYALSFNANCYPWSMKGSLRQSLRLLTSYISLRDKDLQESKDPQVPIAPTTTEQRFARKNELKARGTLLMALPAKHQLKFNIHKDAKTLIDAIEKRFGGNKKTKKVQKTLLMQYTSSQLDNDDLKKIDADDLEEIDLKWQMAMLTMRARRHNATTGTREGILQGSAGHLRTTGIRRLKGGMFQWRLLLLMLWFHSVMVLEAMIGTFRQKKNQPTMPLWHSPPQVLSVLIMSTVFNYDEMFSSESNVSMPTSPVYDRPSAPIIEDWVSDSEDESEGEPMLTQKAPSFVSTFKHVKTPRPSVNPVEHPIPAENLRKDIPKSKGHRHSWKRKACFVCKSLTHLIKDYAYYEKKMVQNPIRNYAMRGNHQQYAIMTHLNPHRHVVPTTILTRSRLVPLNAARPVNTVVPHTKV
nr:hypothetical protein [Tanacetum cinerariifolium]